jgi:hypothetical protein
VQCAAYCCHIILNSQTSSRQTSISLLVESIVREFIGSNESTKFGAKNMNTTKTLLGGPRIGYLLFVWIQEILFIRCVQEILFINVFYLHLTIVV